MNVVSKPIVPKAVAEFVQADVLATLSLVVGDAQSLGVYTYIYVIMGANKGWLLSTNEYNFKLTSLFV